LADTLPGQAPPNYNGVYDANQIRTAANIADDAYRTTRMYLYDLPMLQLEKDKLAANVAQWAVQNALADERLKKVDEYNAQTERDALTHRIAQDAVDSALKQRGLDVQDRQITMDGAVKLLSLAQSEDQANQSAALTAANNAGDQTLEMLKLIGSLSGSRDAFRQQAMYHGLNQLGYSKAIDAVAGRYVAPRVQGLQAEGGQPGLAGVLDGLHGAGGGEKYDGALTPYDVQMAIAGGFLKNRYNTPLSQQTLGAAKQMLPLAMTETPQVNTQAAADYAAKARGMGRQLLDAYRAAVLKQDGGTPAQGPTGVAGQLTPASWDKGPPNTAPGAAPLSEDDAVKLFLNTVPGLDEAAARQLVRENGAYYRATNRELSADELDQRVATKLQDAASRASKPAAAPATYRAPAVASLTTA
jgi:hypothetical protein